MKKNGVAPTAMTYRSVFEGIRISKESLSEDKVLIEKVHNIYRELETIWKNVNTPKSKQNFFGKQQDEEYDDRVAETSTARSYEASKKAMEENLLEYPGAFDTCCVYYSAFLFSIKAYDQASALLERVDELAFPPSVGQSTSKLPFLLSSRYLFEILTADLQEQDELSLQGTVLKAHKTVIAALLKDRTLFVDRNEAGAIIDPNTERLEIDRALYFAISTPAKVSTLSSLICGQ